MRSIKIKNFDTVSRTWGGQIYAVSQEREITDHKLLEDYLADDNFYTANANQKAKISNGESYYEIPKQGWDYLEGELPSEVIPMAPKNEYSLKPYGLAHKHINAANQIYDITLSNKNGKDIDYSNCTTTPQFYDCIFQNDSEVRDGIESVDGSTITTVMGRLANGAAKLSRPVDIDYDIEIMESDASIYLWGIFVDIDGYGDDDIVRMQVIDKNGTGVTLGLYDQATYDYLCSVQGGVAILKEYDECWARHIAKLVEINTPDGSPGEIYTGFTLRVKYYCKDASKTSIKLWKDYKITLKDN